MNQLHCKNKILLTCLNLRIKKLLQPPNFLNCKLLTNTKQLWFIEEEEGGRSVTVTRPGSPPGRSTGAGGRSSRLGH